METTATATERRTAPATPTTAKPQPDEDVTTTPLERLLKEKAAAQKRLAKAQEAFAKLEAKERKIETHYKIKLGAWILSACKKAEKNAFSEVVAFSMKINQQLPDDLAAWLDQLSNPEAK